MDDTSRRQFAQELTAIEEGGVPYRAELAQALGTQSLDGAGTREDQESIDDAHANMELIKRFAHLLPHPINPLAHKRGCEGYPKDSFVFGKDEDPQHKVRAIQSHALWLMGPDKGGEPLFGTVPFFVLGSRKVVHPVNPTSTTKVESTQLLLVNPTAPDRLYAPFVDTATFEEHQKVATIQEARPLDDSEVESMLDKQSNRIVVNYWSKGSFTSEDDTTFFTRKPIIEKPGNIFVWKKFVNFFGPGSPLTNKEMEEFGVKTGLAELSVAFGFEDRYRALLAGDGEEAQPSEETSSSADLLPEVRAERLKNQNTELREALIGMMVGSGMMSQGEAQEFVEKKFPVL